MNLKTFAMLCLMCVLAACSSVSKPDRDGVRPADEPQTYLVDGIAYTPEKMNAFASQNDTVFYVATPEAFSSGQVHVFTDQADYASFKKQYTREVGRKLTPQTSCWTDLDSKTSLYKGSGYSSSLLKLVKGSSYTGADLGSFNQTISSVKGACSVWTDMYDGSNFTGTTWSTFGNNFTGLPSWIDNDTSSVKVGR